MKRLTAIALIATLVVLVQSETFLQDATTTSTESYGYAVASTEPLTDSTSTSTTTVDASTSLPEEFVMPTTIPDDLVITPPAETATTEVVSTDAWVEFQDEYVDLSNEWVAETVDEMIVKVDIEKIKDFVGHASEFAGEYQSQVADEAMLVAQALSEAYKTTAAKIILNYGSVYAPFMEKFGEVLGNVNANTDCDQTCAVKCWEPSTSQYRTLGFENTCLTGCGCVFLYQNLTSAEQTELMELQMEFVETVWTASEYSTELEQEFLTTVIPAYYDYAVAESNLTEQFAELVRQQAVDILDCDETCINDCTNSTYITFWEIPQCLAWCSCQQDFMDFSYGEFNYPLLMAYSEYDLKAWSFFKRYQHQI